MFLLLLLVAFIITQDGNPLTLENETTVNCVVQSTDQPIFWEPPIIGLPQNVKSLLEDNNVWNGWDLQRSLEGLLPPVTDKRWEDFRVDFTQHHNFSFHSFVSFYVHNSTKLRLYLTNQYGVLQEFKLTPQKKSFWTFYTIFRNNGIIEFFDNSVKIGDVLDKSFNHVGVRSEEKLYWKIPEYSVRMAYDSSDKPTSLTIPPSGNSCLLIYTYLCYNCSLEVLVKTENSTDIFVVNSTEITNLLWQQLKINLEPYETPEVILQRKDNNTDKSQSFWVVDVRLCPELKGNLGIYTIKKMVSKFTNYKCYTMDQNEISTSASTELLEEESFCSQPGKLGKECEIKCEDIFGLNHKFCEKLAICNGYKCTCAWGYTGPTCSETCISGTWGLSCQNTCTPECPACDKITGKCVANDSTNVVLIIFIVVAILAVFGTGMGYVLFKRRSDGGENENGRDIENMIRSQVPLMERSEIVNE